VDSFQFFESGELIYSKKMQASTPHATAIAYPIGTNPTNPSQPSPSLDPNLFSLDQSTFSTNDSIDLGNNFFSQLDSMIAAVKVESNALDTMRERLKEVDNLRSQISSFTKRIIDADQLNLNLKTSLVKQQEAYNDLKKQKTEIESNAVSLRQELTRTKDALNKERAARQQMQQELQTIKEQYGRLEVLRDNLDREVKAIPALTESNEILKNDLANVRKRFKEEKASLTKQIKFLEGQVKDTEGLKGEVRQLAVRLMEISGAQMAPSASSLPTNYGASSAMGRFDPSASVMSLQSYRTTNTQHQQQPTQTHHTTSYTFDEDDDDDDNDNSHADDRSYLGTAENESEYDNASFIDDNVSQASLPVNSSIDSLTMPHSGNHHHHHHMSNHSSSNNMMIQPSTKSSSGKKKKVKKPVVTSTQRLSNNSSSHNTPVQQHLHQGNMQNMMHNSNMMQSSFSLPRI